MEASEVTRHPCGDAEIGSFIKTIAAVESWGEARAMRAHIITNA